MRAMVLTLGLALAATVPAAAQVNISTTTGGVDRWSHLPVGQGQTTPWNYDGWGQLFTALTPFLTDFALYVTDLAGPGQITFRAHVAAWTGSGIGPLLWSSGSIASPTAPYPGSGVPLSSLQRLQFATGLTLAAGSTYLAFLFPETAGQVAVEDYGSMYRRRSTSPTLADGSGGGVLIRSSAAPSLGTATYLRFTTSDVAFDATFQSVPVPEPKPTALLLAALMGLVVVARRRPGHDGPGPGFGTTSS